MSRYELRFSRQGEKDPKTIQFEAEDASMALILAHREASDRPAELWRDGQRICTIKRKVVYEAELWVVGGQNRPNRGPTAAP